jgi:hypothetical protein
MQSQVTETPAIKGERHECGSCGGGKCRQAHHHPNSRPIAYTTRTQPPAIATDANVDNIIVAKVDGESQFIATLGRLWRGCSRSWLPSPSSCGGNIARTTARENQKDGAPVQRRPQAERSQCEVLFRHHDARPHPVEELLFCHEQAVGPPAGPGGDRRRACRARPEHRRRAAAAGATAYGNSRIREPRRLLPDSTGLRRAAADKNLPSLQPIGLVCGGLQFGAGSCVGRVAE